MKTTSLKKYLERNTQVEAAITLGVTQQGIGKALHSGRDIKVVTVRGVVVNAYSINGFGRFAK